MFCGSSAFLQNNEIANTINEIEIDECMKNLIEQWQI